MQRFHHSIGSTSICNALDDDYSLYDMSAQEEYSNFSHDVYVNDPVLVRSYIGKQVKITMKYRHIHCGVIYTVDPVSGSIVLLQSEKPTRYRLKIISGHAIKSIGVTAKTETVIPVLFPSFKTSQATINKRKTIVMQLLSDNRFLVKEKDDTLIIEDIVWIEPPYYPENCTCTNSIILSRIQSILTRVSVK